VSLSRGPRVRASTRCALDPQLLDLAWPDQVKADRIQLGDEPVVTGAASLGFSSGRSCRLHLSHEIVIRCAAGVALGRLEPALRLFPCVAELGSRPPPRYAAPSSGRPLSPRRYPARRSRAAGGRFPLSETVLDSSSRHGSPLIITSDHPLSEQHPRDCAFGDSIAVAARCCRSSARPSGPGRRAGDRQLRE